MILLDTNALIWLQQSHRRARSLTTAPRLYLSPATVLEMQFLLEAQRIRFHGLASLSAVVADGRWLLDEPPAGRWFMAAADVSWTRDPFDRLIAAHAVLRGWKLATGDAAVIQGLGDARVVAL